MKKSAWTPEEDQLLLSLFEKHPNKWSRIAREIPGRTDDACSKRYREALDPNLKKDEWEEEEDKRLLDALVRHGGAMRPKWVLIGQELCRSSLGCRNRWRLLERKRRASLRRDNASGGQQNVENPAVPDSLDIWSLLAGSGPSSDWELVMNSLGVPLENLSGPAGHDTGFIIPFGERTEISHPPVESVSAGSTTNLNHHQEIPGGAVPALPESLRIATDISSTSSEVGQNVRNIQLNGTAGSAAPSSTSSPGNDVSPDYSFDVSDAIDYGDSRDSDSFCVYDADTQISCLTEQDGTREALGEQHHTQETPGNAQTSNSLFTHDTENFGSLGTLAQAASTLSPSPLVGTDTGRAQQGGNSTVFPPRQRRRPAAGSFAHAGMHVISDISGRPRSEPKLSSSLPVAGEFVSLASILFLFRN